MPEARIPKHLETIARLPRIGIVSFSAIADDPRVRRQGDVFWEHGWDVVGIGLSGALSGPPAWRCTEISAKDDQGLKEPLDKVAGPTELARPGDVSPRPGLSVGAIRQMWRHLPRSFQRVIHDNVRLAQRLVGVIRVYMKAGSADKSYWQLNDRFGSLYEAAARETVDLWLANDWNVLPIVRKLAAEQGVPYAYDTHELAVDEYAERWRWRLLHRPLVAAIERAGIAGAAMTACVSQGIADRLQSLFDLPSQPLVIRNMPHYHPYPFRPAGDMIDVLYHGIVNEGRGLEICIDSVALWRPEFRLTIRGPAPEAYFASLEARIAALGLQDRVRLASPVPMVDLVEAATAFDIGLFALPGHSQQNVHVLPNKFFEYTMAGLALCVSDLPEMTALLRHYDLGRLIPEVTPQAIAEAINGFDRPAIDAYKQRALQAAKVLNWEAEANCFFTAISQAVAGAGRPAVPR